MNFTGTFTASTSVSSTEIISTTTTRKSGATTYDITSEFSLNYTVPAPSTELATLDEVDVYDPLSEGLYFVPGNDAIRTLSITNIGGAPTSADSIVLIVNVADNVDFYNGDIDDGGPQTNAVAFDQIAGGGLTFTYGTGVAFSNSITKPGAMVDCSYTPASGYDSAVTFICMNPKGQLMNSDPNPFVTLSYRSKIK